VNDRLKSGNSVEMHRNDISGVGIPCVRFAPRPLALREEDVPPLSFGHFPR